jgi:hypothetical protein
MENNATIPQNINFTIPVLLYKKAEALKKIEVLKKATKKYKVAEPVITISEPFVKKMVSKDSPEVFEYDVFNLTIDVAPSFKLEGGYTLQAIVDNATDNAVAIDIDSFNIPLELLTSSHKCDHCGISRDRNKTFILQNPENELIRVGSTCVKKFLGINPQTFIAMLNFYNEFREDTFGNFGEQSFYTERAKSNHGVVVKIEEAITALNTIIAEDNGVIIKAEYEEYEVNNGWNSYWDRRRTNLGKSTCERASAMVLDSRYSKTPLVIDTAYVNSFISFIENLESNIVFDELDNRFVFASNFDSFKNDLKKFAERDVMRLGDIYPLCGGISYFEKFKVTEAERTLKGESEFVGTIGTKHKFNVTLVDYKSGEGMYGTWYLWTFVDGDNNTITKFGTLSDKYRVSVGTEKLSYEFNKGDKFAFTADVKAHKEFRGIKSTELGRLSKI